MGRRQVPVSRSRTVFGSTIWGRARGSRWLPRSPGASTLGRGAQPSWPDAGDATGIPLSSTSPVGANPSSRLRRSVNDRGTADRADPLEAVGDLTIVLGQIGDRHSGRALIAAFTMLAAPMGPGTVLAVQDRALGLGLKRFADATPARSRHCHRSFADRLGPGSRDGRCGSAPSFPPSHGRAQRSLQARNERERSQWTASTVLHQDAGWPERTRVRT